MLVVVILSSQIAHAQSHLFESSNAFESDWEYMGPPSNAVYSGTQPGLGLVDAVAMIPSNPDVKFASSNTSGMYKTVDNGETWYSVTDDLNLAGLGISCITVDPNDHTRLFATTGVISNNYGGFCSDLLLSTDQGESWEVIDVPGLNWANHDKNSPSLSVVRFDPFNNNRMLLGGYRALWVSEDYGDSWTPVNNWSSSFETNGYLTDPAEDWFFSDIEFNPEVPGEVYACTTAMLAYANTSFIMKSADGGLNWDILENANGLLPNPGMEKAIRLDFTPADPGVLYAMYRKASPPNLEFSKSTDGGQTWINLYTSNVADNFWHEWKAEFEMSDVQSDLAYYGGIRLSVLKMNNGSWSSSNQNNSLHDDIRDIKIYNPGNGQEYVLIAHDGGISGKQTNPAAILNNINTVWDNLNGDGLLLTQIYGGGSWNADDRGLYGTQDNGTWKYSTVDYSRMTGVSGDGAYSNVSKFFDGIGVVGNQTSRRCASNYGSSTSFLWPGANSPRTLRVKQFYNLKDESKLSLAAQEFKLYQFNPGTCTSTEISLGLIGLDGNGNYIAAHAVAPSNSDVIYIFYEGIDWGGDPQSNRFFRSMDGGETFTDLSASFKVGNFYPYSWNEPKFLTVDPRDPMHLFVGMKRYRNNLNSSEDKNLYESEDGGLTWSPMAEGLGPHGVQSLYYVDGSDELIFAATDAGVYVWDKPGEQWHPINGNLPPCIVADLDYDYCTRTLSAYTYGKGIWAIEVPPFEEDYIVEEDLFIEPYEQHVFENDVVVKDGATLTVTGHLFFKEHGRLVVEKGGKLIVDGGFLSAKCGEMWQGVEVHGDDQLSQVPSSNQGHVVLKNGAIIENAHTGIWLRRNDATCELVQGSGGGIVYASDSQIKNCYVGVEFAPYKDLRTITVDNVATQVIISNKSFFDNVTFIQDDVLLNDGLLKAHARLMEVFGIHFRGCSFIDELPDQAAFQSYYAGGYKAMGIGIDSHSSTFTVSPDCDGPWNDNGNCTGNEIRSYFEGLEFGILATDAFGDRPFRVSESDFQGNIVGVYASGMGSAVSSIITENHFVMHPVAAGLEADGDLTEVIGTMLQGVGGFELEENTFEANYTLGNGNPEQTSLGVAFVQNGIHSNAAYRNSFDGLDYAVHVQEENGGQNNDGDWQGIQVLCNTFGQHGTANGLDIHLPEGGKMAISQGTTNFASRNEFSHATGCLQEDLDTDILVAEAAGFFSYYYTGGSDENDISNVEKPICFSEATVGDSWMDLQFNNQQCDGDLSYQSPSAHHINVRSASETILDDVRDLYHDKLDKGNPKALADFIRDATHSSIEVRNEMISCVPYISDEAWKVAFTRQPAMNEWHLAQVLLQSSPLKKTVVHMMDTYNLAPFYRELVLDGQNGGVTHLSILESELNHYALQRWGALQDHNSNQILSSEEEQNYGAALAQINPDYTLKDALSAAAMHLTTGNLSAAQEQLNKDTPTDNTFEVLAVLIEALEEDTCVKFQTNQINVLKSISSQEKVPGAFQARAALRQVEEEEVRYDLRFAEGNKQRKKPTTENKPTFTVYPNPVADLAYLTTTIPEGVEQVSVQIIDMQGKLVLSLENTKPIGIVELDVAHLELGMYLVKLYYDQIEIGNEKLLIVR